MDRGPAEKTLNSGLFMFTLPDHTGRPRDTLRELLEAHLAWDRLRRATARVEWALILAGVLPAISLVWPAAIPVGARMLAFVVWMWLLATLAALRVQEYRCHRRMLGLASTDAR